MFTVFILPVRMVLLPMDRRSLLAREMSPVVFFALVTARGGEVVAEGANAY